MKDFEMFYLYAEFLFIKERIPWPHIFYTNMNINHLKYTIYTRVCIY